MKKPSLFALTMISTSLLFVTGCLAGVRIPAAHQHKAAAQTQVRTVSVTSKSANVPTVYDQVSFPPLIKSALNKIRGRALSAVEAPTVLPVFVTGSDKISAKVTTQMTTNPGYNVLLLSHGHRVADFSGNTYKTQGTAAAGVELGPGTLPSGIATTTMKVGSVSALGITYQPSGENTSNKTQGSFTMLKWTQDKWSITVRASGAHQLPMLTAERIEQFILTHGLPTPHSQAALLVTVGQPDSSFPANLDNRSVKAFAVWQDGKHVYETDTYAACREPIETVFSMAGSMQSNH